MRAAPVVAIVAYDAHYLDQITRLFPAVDVRPYFAGNEGLIRDTAFRNSTLQGAYFIMAARALGLDVCPMSGFNNAGVDEAFFQDRGWRSNFLCTLGYGDDTRLFPAALACASTRACDIVRGRSWMDRPVAGRPAVTRRAMGSGHHRRREASRRPLAGTASRSAKSGPPAGIPAVGSSRSDSCRRCRTTPATTAQRHKPTAAGRLAVTAGVIVQPAIHFVAALDDRRRDPRWSSARTSAQRASFQRK